MDVLKKFWNYTSNNPPTNANHEKVKTAYVLPKDYGFGFRSAQDNIWGLWNADAQSQKIWMDVNALARQDGSNFDIVCNDAQFKQTTENRYNSLIYWNQTLNG